MTLITIITLLTLTVSYALLFDRETKNSLYHIDHLQGNLYNERLLPTTEHFTNRGSVAIPDLDAIKDKWSGNSIEPKYWGERVPGVMNRMDTDERVIALTFDACGGVYGSGYDEKLINFLRKEEIPATLFINARWIKENKEVFLELSNDSLFQIENHGTEHLPLSLKGGTAWGIMGTTGVEEVIREVMGNQELIYSLTGNVPNYYRSGTAYYDEIAVEIVGDLGLTVVNYDILGDAGATYNSTQVRNALLNANPGSIALLHMNQPASGTAVGVMEAIPLLREQGFTFVTLSEFDLTE
ncbi:peptidoglycan/xylan/chitin deacetylase (PgdA/CDA1 family) [Evansella vedderi]|uniref:Peptidoglycan/xylan/chitin deacetylase (PgdA/CDA1 family) n=2 Tax=Evansella vedderi TaxID=38282 RepID=A0ABT9ZVH8_9BACI|nr:peptidoglycan/xylan/chitin deacetylase (PgdA/CDA1 family) [Evansella vedderi]